MNDTKFVIRFKDGTYWRCFETITADLDEAWTFNKAAGAEGCAKTNKLEDFEVREVRITFAYLPGKHNLHAELV